MTIIGYATLQVIPSLKGVSEAISKQLGVLSTDGKRLGKALGDGMAGGVEAAAKKVEQASAKVTAARNKEADAAGRLRTAQAQLQTLTDRGVTDAGRLAAAEERVAKSKRDHESASKTLRRTVDDESAAQGKLTEAKEKAAKASDDAANGGGRFSNMLGGLRDKLGSASAGTDGLAGKLGGLSAKLGGLLKIAGTGGALALPGLALAKGFQRLQDIDTAKAKLTALGQDTESVSVIMKNALAAVDKTKFGLGDAASVAGVIVGAGVKPGEELERTLKQVADTAAITGGSLDDIGAIYGKVAANGKLDGEVMAQLLERQIGLLPKLAEKYHVSADEASKMVSQGKVSFQDFQSAMDALVGGGAVKMGNTFQAQMDNVMAALGRLGASALGPVFEVLPGIIEKVTAGINKLTPALTAAGGWLKQYSGWIIPIAAGVGAVVVAFKAWTTAIAVWRGIAAAATAVQIAWNLAMAANPIGLIVLAVVGLGAALVTAYKRSETFRDIVNGVWNAVKAVVGAVVSWFTDTAWPAIKGAWQWIQDAFTNGKAVIDAVIESIKLVWQSLVAKAGEVKDWIVEKWNALLDFFRGLPTKFGELASGIFEPFRNAAKTVFNGVAKIWNSTIGALSWTTPDWIPGIGGKTISAPKLPEFDRGGHTGNLPLDQIAGVVHGGEFVVKAASTRRIEDAYPGLLDRLNTMGALPGYAAGGLVAGAQELRRIIGEKFGIKNIGGYRPGGAGYNEHVTGRALDVMVGGDKSKGDAVKDFALSNSDAIDLKWVIWRQHLFYPGGGGYDMPDRGSPTQNHMDHVHIFSGTGIVDGLRGALKGGAAAPAVSPVAANQPDPTGISAPDQTGATTDSGSISGGIAIPDSITGLSKLGLDDLGKGVGTTSTGSDLSLFGKAGGSAIEGQVSSALGVLGVGNTPGWLKGISQFVGGISVTDKATGRKVFDGKNIGGVFSGGGGPDYGGAAPMSANVTGTAAPTEAHGGRAGQQPGPTFNTTIQARDAEGALEQWQRKQNEIMASKLARY